MEIMSNWTKFPIFLLVFVALFLGCAENPKRTSILPSHRKPSEKTLESHSDPTLESKHPRTPLRSENAQSIPKPAPIRISEPTKTVVRPVHTPEMMQASPPVQKDPTPDLGRKLPKLIYSEELGLYTSPSAIYEIYFWNARWYVRSEGSWFQSKNYQGPWEKIDASALPERLRR